MKAVKTYFEAMDSAAVDAFENHGFVEFEDQGQTVRVDLIDAEVVTEDIPGMLVATGDGLTVALDAYCLGIFFGKLEPPLGGCHRLWNRVDLH